MRRGDISQCQPHSNYASLNLIPFTLHLSLSFQCPILRTFSTTGPFPFLLSISFSFQSYLLRQHSIHSPSFSFFSVSKSTFSTITRFTLHLSLSFQFPILPSQPSFYSITIFLFLSSLQSYLLNHHSIHSPSFSFFSVSKTTFATILPFTLHLSISYQFPILLSQPSLHSLSTFLFLFNANSAYLLNHRAIPFPPFSSFILLSILSQCPLQPVSTFPFFNFPSSPLPFPLSLCSLQPPFTSLQNLSLEDRQCPKRTCVHIVYL